MQKRNNIGWYLMILIPIVGTLLFNIYPLFVTIINSFQNTKGELIGMTNYEILFADETFKISVINTLYMAVLGVSITLVLAFAIANMLNNILRGKNVYKFAFLLPMIMSMVTVAYLFKYLMMPDETGIINYFLSFIGLGPYPFFNSPDTSRESVIAMALWKGTGYNIIIFFAGLQSVPVELYEASKIDGANEWKRWTHITIPCMKNIFVFVLITATIGALKRFTEVYAVSGETGNPGNSLLTIMLYIYKNSFSTLNYKDVGLASAASIILFIMVLFFTFINFVVTKDRGKSRSKFRQKR